MVRATNAVASHRRKKRLFKRAKGFFGDRKNHLRQTLDAVRRAMAYTFAHRKLKKRDFRHLWTTRLSAAAKIHGISYSKMMFGLKKAGCGLNRKMLAELAIQDPGSFAILMQQVKQAVA